MLARRTLYLSHYLPQYSSQYLRSFAVTCTILTYLLASMTPAHAASPAPQLLHAFNSVGEFVQADGVFYFSATDDAHGNELWKSDGTPAGTVLVKDIAPDAASSNPKFLTMMGDTLFFVADNGTNGFELWKSDGTAAGTVMVKDIDPGEGSGGPNNLTVMDDLLFFGASNQTMDFVANRELWKSDGTEAGTVMVKEIRADEDGSYPTSLTVVGDTLFFSADDYDQPNQRNRALWKSDGTEAGTVMVKDLLVEEEGAFNPESSVPQDLVALGDILIFRAFTAPEHIFGTPWAMFKSDGTEAGTVKVRDMFGGAEGVSDEWHPTLLNGELFLAALVTDFGDELWKTDGTTAGTVIVKDINPNNNNVFPRSIGNLLLVGDTIFLATEDGTRGTELWKSDGTTAGTTLVKDIRLGSTSSNPGDFVAAGDTLYFTADDGNGRALWQSDGVETMAVESVLPATYASARPLFGGDDASGNPLYFFAITEEAAGIFTLSGGEAFVPPTAVNDAATTTGSTPVSGNVLSNDEDLQDSPLTVSGSEQPSHGVVTVSATGDFTYTAAANFSGVDVFSYTVSNSHSLSATAEVIVVVQPAAVTDEVPTMVVTTPGVTTTHAITDDNFSLSLQVPANAYSGTLEPGDSFFLVYTPVVTPTGSVEDAPTNFEFAGMTFSLGSYLNETAFDSYTFAEPLILEIEYPASAVVGLVPDELTLFYWDTESDSWASDGIEVIAHNVANRTITLAISHLTEFGLFSQADPGVPDEEDILYIPSAWRQEDQE